MLRHTSLRLLENRLFWAILLAGVFAANAIWCSRNRLAGDVSWYLYAVKRLREGAVLYRDLHDMNPPVVYLMYMPLGWLNHITGLRIDWLLYAGLGAATAAIAAWTWRIPHLSYVVRSLFALSIAFASLSLNRFQLGQRDPICALLFTGLAISAYLRLQNEAPGWISWLGVATASLGMAMKPHFLAPWALVMAFLAWRIGFKRVLRMKELWMPLAVSVIAWSITFLAFPDFRTMVGVAYRYYSNIKVSPYEFSPLLVPLVVAAFAWARRTPLLQISALATLGFVASCALQRKGFPYHMAPSMYWAAICVGLLLADWFERRDARVPILAIAALLPIYSLWTATFPPPAFFASTDVEEFVKANARGKTVLTLSTDLRTGFPLILEADALNARADAQLWMLGQMYRDQVLRSEAAVQPVAAQYHTPAQMDDGEREYFHEVTDILDHKRPTIILVQTAKRKWGLDDLQFDFIDYFSTDPRLRDLLRSYKPGPTNDRTRVLVLDPTAVADAGVAR